MAVVAILSLAPMLAAPAPAAPAPKDYTLSPRQRARAIEYARKSYALYFASEALIVIALGVMVKLRAGSRLRTWAVKRSRLRALQAPLVAGPVLGALALILLPLDVYGEMLSRYYGQSIEDWPSWFADWAKEQALILIVGTLLVWGLYALMRRSPARWWLYGWLISLPLQAAAVFAGPLAVEPLFNEFQPLSARHPSLVEQIEEILGRAGVSIPPSRMFEMRASAKTNELNAYVSGFGSSKRLVLYDTIIAKENGPPLLATVGHELGHYVLHHIQYGLLFGFALALSGFALIFAVLRRAHAVSAAGEWDSLPLLLLLCAVLGFLATPAIAAFSRMQEHAADVYSIELLHGIVPDPGAAAATAFQIEGESGLADPDPSSFIRFWLFTHPPLAERLRFSLSYRPWASGSGPRYIK